MSDLVGTKGGSGVWQRIISEMPAHRVYIEPFWGRGTISRHKRPADITIGCDLDPDAISDGRGLALMFQADGVQWLRDYFRLQDAPPDSLAVATAAGSGDSRSIAATFGGFSWREHFVYLDPPYLVPNVDKYYTHVLTEDEHRVLCRLFRRLPCGAALSGYASRIYEDELDGCRLVKIPTTNRAGRRVIEHLWLNFDPPQRYHDVRFIGTDRRERERIRRRQKHWSRGLAKLPAAERQAIFEACQAAHLEVTSPDEAAGDDGLPAPTDGAAHE